MTATDRVTARSILAKLLPPDPREPWMVGVGDWERRLEASEVESVFATDAEKAACLDAVRKRLDEFKNVDGRSIVSLVLGKERNEPSLLLRFLALGLDPDLCDEDGSTSSHFVSWTYDWRSTYRPEPAKALVLSRPDLTKLDKKGRTPLQVAEDKVQSLAGDEAGMEFFEDICKIWMSVQSKGFTVLGQLARDRIWFAVKNLCRRRAVTLDEVCSDFEGKNVVQWAEHHGEFELSREIRFLFGYSKTAEPARGLGLLEVGDAAAAAELAKLKAEVKKLNAVLAAHDESVQEKLRTAHCKMNGIKDQLEGYLGIQDAGASARKSMMSTIDCFLRGIRNAALDGFAAEVLEQLARVACELTESGVSKKRKL